MPRFRTVIFDCDSTLSTVEGIEELATAHRAEVTTLTEAAMRGEVPLDAVYGRRLALVRPTREAVCALGRRYVETLVPDAHETIAALVMSAIEVRVISGGLRPAVLTLTRALGLPDDAVAAVDVHFDDKGQYAGFDERSPLARAGGKRATLEAWLPSLARPIMFVGDGATDLEARPLVECFVAFAGVIERPKVIAAADVVVAACSLAPIVPLAIGEDVPVDDGVRAICAKGLHLLGGRRPPNDLRLESATHARRDR